jgi:hypothetical protein
MTSAAWLPQMLITPHFNDEDSITCSLHRNCVDGHSNTNTATTMVDRDRGEMPRNLAWSSNAC